MSHFSQMRQQIPPHPEKWKKASTSSQKAWSLITSLKIQLQLQKIQKSALEMIKIRQIYYSCPQMAMDCFAFFEKLLYFAMILKLSQMS